MLLAWRNLLFSLLLLLVAVFFATVFAYGLADLESVAAHSSWWQHYSVTVLSTEIAMIAACALALMLHDNRSC